MSYSTNSLDMTKLPLEVRAKLAELDIEISEGDITQKGYDKKRLKLLEPYLSSAQSAALARVKEAPPLREVKKRSPPSRAKRQARQMHRNRHSRRDDRYRSDAHSEAVQLALSKHQSKRLPVIPLAVKRRSLMIHNSVDESSDEDAASTTDDDGSLRRQTDNSSTGGSAVPSPVGTQRPMPSPQKTVITSPEIKKQDSRTILPNDTLSSFGEIQVDTLSSCSSVTTDTMSSCGEIKVEKRRAEVSQRYVPPTPLAKKLADIMPQILPEGRPISQDIPPDVANISVSGHMVPPSTAVPAMSSLDITFNSKKAQRPSLTSLESESEDIAVTKVSAKIQQLLLTLKRPKKKPLVEYFQDEQEELLENVLIDENTPKPEGTVTAPREGTPLNTQVNVPHSVEAAIHRLGTVNPKAACLTSVDRNGKQSQTLTYGKLLSRMRKVAFTLTSKKFNLESGQRVALVFPNTEPILFSCAFYGCLLGGLVPVVVEVPMTSEDPGSSQLGFLLGSCSVNVALTSEHCLKALPKNDKGEVNQLKGWPRLQWILIDSRNLTKPPSNWEPSGHNNPEQLAYIEYKNGKEGSVMGIAHTRTAVHRHCKALVGALSYNPGDIMVNLLDFKRGLGLVHGILASMFCGMQVICIPYALMKQNPVQWLNIITKFKASVALVKSRDLHWTLAMQRDSSNINLKTLRMLVVSDGANPWSIGSCDMFLAEYERRGLGRKAICPCAWSPEAMTVAVKRPGSSPVRTALSLNGMSFNVIREETPVSLVPAVVLQDCGNILPGCTVAVVKTKGEPNLCRVDEIGEILLCSKPDTNDVESRYFGLKGRTEKNFQAHPVDESNHGQREEAFYTRTGLLGYVNPSGRVLITGKIDGMLRENGRVHNADDIVATVLAIEPIRFVYRGRIAVFGVNVLRSEKLVIVVEQKHDCREEECHQWMSSVMQAVEEIHNVGVYCLSLLAPNGLPRTPLGGVHLSETRNRFLEGNLEPRNILMSPHQCVHNLPKPRQKHHDVGPASILQGQVVTGLKLAEAKGRELTPFEEDEIAGNRYQFMSEILKWRAINMPDHVIYSQVGSKGNIASQLSCSQLHKKADKVAQLLLSHSTGAGMGSLSTGDHVALLFPPGLDLIVAFYGCLYAGCVPVPIRPPHAKALSSTLPTVRMVVQVSKATAVLSCNSIIKMIRSKDGVLAVHARGINPIWPQILDIEDSSKKRVVVSYRPPTTELLAYVDFSVTTSGTLVGIKMSHHSASELCRTMKLQCELYSSRSVGLCLDPYSGLGLVLWCLSSVYSGHQSLLIPPPDLETNPQLWLHAISQNKIRDTFLSYSVVELCTRGLAPHIPNLKTRGVTLSHVRTCVMVAEERPRVSLTINFTKLLRDLNLSPRAVTTAFGCRVNVAVCLQGASCPDPTTVYLDMRALRNDRVALVEKGSPQSLCLMETGKILPGTKVVIADPNTLVQCSDSRLGEIWVSSPHTAHGYYAVYGGDANATHDGHFQAHLKTGDTQTQYARTGFLGFLRRTELMSATGERHDALYVVGPLDETIELRGMRYHPTDIEISVIRCSSKITECAVFHSSNLLVAVVELEGMETSALDLVPLVTNVILEEHYLIAGVVAVCDPGSIPVNSRGEKQRMHLRDAFMQDRLNPIYVAYNM